MTISLTEWLTERIARAVRRAPNVIGKNQAFHEFGLESIDLVEISGELEVLLGRRIDPDLLYEFPTISALAGHLEGRDAAAAGQAKPAACETEAIAIVGIGCRFPGAASPDEFWRLLQAGGDAISEVPPDRWDTEVYYDPEPGAPGKTNSKWGGFLGDVDGFDYSFFGITAAEAVAMDPQQRLLLEVCWEAFEDAGQPMRALRGTDVGVFVGVSHNDYEAVHLNDLARASHFSGSGAALSIVANRLSYQFDFRGPSIAVDTACSSSLTAVHLAIRSLRARESALAVAGGVNILLSPNPTVVFSQAGMMAPDGRCKPFDAAANGYVRGEGVGLVVLKRLSDALADQDRIYAVLRGSAVNQDGRSNGLNAPNPAAQEAVLRAAYADAQLMPASIAYVEAHGTGTKLGDPIEASALARVVGSGSGRIGRCLLGSVKSNIGHLESAAGVAGLIKAALIAHHGSIPPSLHYAVPNPHIPFESNGLEVATASTNLGDRARIGVSSFGFGGTNCHLVLEQIEPGGKRAAAGRAEPSLVLLSAASAPALAQLKARWLAQLAAQAPSSSVAALARSAALERDHFSHRWAAASTDAAGLMSRLEQDVADERPVAKLAFVYPGQGSLFKGMALDLADRFPPVRASLERADAVLAPLVGGSILEAIGSGDRLLETSIAQPAIAAVQMAISDLLASIGIEPAGVVGHSVGEIAAAYAAGQLDFDEALRVAAVRGRLMDREDAAGAMLTVSLGEADVRQAIAAAAIDADVAAVNARQSTVVSGQRPHLEHLAGRLKADGVACRFLEVRYAFHGRRMAAASEAIASALGPVRSGSPVCPVYSTVLGEAFDGAFDAAYWADNARCAVSFAPAIDRMVGDGFDCFVEIGPDAVLSPLLKRWSGGLQAFSLMGRKSAGPQTLLEGLGALYRAGLTIDARPLFPGERTSVRCPGHPWARSAELRDARLEAQRAAARPSAGRRHEALGIPVALPAGVPLKLWEGSIGSDEAPWLLDHQVAGSPVFPAAAVLALFEAAGREACATGAIELSDLVIHRPLLIDTDRSFPAVVKAELDVSTATWRAALMVQHPGDTYEPFAEVRMRPSGDVAPDDELRLSGAQARCLERVAPERFYDRLAAVGLGYAGAFRPLAQVWRRDGEALGELHAELPALPGFPVHPGTLDGALQLVAAALPSFWDASSPWLPASIDKVLIANASRVRFVHARLDEVDEVNGRLLASISFWDEMGASVGELAGLVINRLSRANSAAMRQARLLSAHHFYRDDWRARAVGAQATAPQRIVLLLDAEGLGRPLGPELQAAGHDVIVVEPAAPASAAGRPVDPYDAAHVQHCLQAATADGRLVDAVVCLWPLDLRIGAPARLGSALASVARLIRSLAYFGGARPPRLWLVTRGAVDVTASDAVGPSQAAVSGLGLAAAFEAPALRTTRLDLDPAAGGAVRSFEALSRLLGDGADDGDQFAERAGQIHVRRIVSIAGKLAHTELKGDSAYIITGGTGAIGISLARALSEHGARHIQLFGRRTIEAPALSRIDRLRAEGANVSYQVVDVGDAEQLGAALAMIRRERPIAGIFHAAGHLKDGPLLDLDETAVDSVLQGKALGAWNLHELTAADPLDVFVLFSSAAAVVGSFGQSAYMAANAYLAGLAGHRRGLGRPVLCIDWGPWADAGMAAEAASQGRGGSAVAGVSMIRHEDGVRLLLGQIGGAEARIMVLPYDITDLLHLYPDTLGLSVFDQLVDRQVQQRRSQGGAPRIASRPALAQPYVEPRTEIESLIASIWQRALKIEPIGVRDPFFELGGDSVFAGQVLSEINRALGVSIDHEAAFEELTIEHLARLVDLALIAAVEGMSEEDLDMALEEGAATGEPAALVD